MELSIEILHGRHFYSNGDFHGLQEDQLTFKCPAFIAMVTISRFTTFYVRNQHISSFSNRKGKKLRKCALILCWTKVIYRLCINCTSPSLLLVIIKIGAICLQLQSERAQPKFTKFARHLVYLKNWEFYQQTKLSKIAMHFVFEKPQWENHNFLQCFGG